jgi:hypothetical protein
VVGLDGKSYPSTRPTPSSSKVAPTPSSLTERPEQNYSKPNKEIAEKLNIPTRVVSKVRKELQARIDAIPPLCPNTYQDFMAIYDAGEKVKKNIEDGTGWHESSLDSYVEQCETIINLFKEILHVIERTRPYQISPSKTVPQDVNIHGNTTVN